MEAEAEEEGLGPVCELVMVVTEETRAMLELELEPMLELELL